MLSSLGHMILGTSKSKPISTLGKVYRRRQSSARVTRIREKNGLTKVHRKLVKIPGEDKLTEGIRTLVRTKVSAPHEYFHPVSLLVDSSQSHTWQEVSLWLVLALQVQLDVHYMLLQATSRGFTELAATSKQTITTLESYLSFSKNMQLDSWATQNNKTMELVILECTMFIEQDFLDTAREVIYDNAGLTRTGDFVLLKRNPVLCGMVMFRLNILIHELGIVVANAWGAVPCILHLVGHVPFLSNISRSGSRFVLRT